MIDQTESRATRRSVFASVAVNLIEAIGLAVASWITGSFALRAQTADNVAELAVGLFLCIGVLSSARPSDQTHPLGYGRERFFWSLFAALGIFVGGGGLALEGAIRSALHPTPIGSYFVAYLVLGVTILLDVIALLVALPPLRRQAFERGLSLRDHLLRNSDPALTTVAVSGACAVIGGGLATIGLVASQVMGSPTPDTVASALIGLLLLVTSAYLLRTNRELLTGRGVTSSTLTEMREIVMKQAGVEGVPDIFAVFVGPSSVIVNGDLIFADDFGVPAVEDSIIHAAAALRERWPAIEYVYLTPVPLARPRRVRRPSRRSSKTK
jgi:cation diffusion facilitator family transporter